jgi:hypothetical protein
MKTVESLKDFLQCGDSEDYKGNVDILTLTDQENADLMNMQSPVFNDKTVQPGQLLVHLKSVSLKVALERVQDLLFRLKPETVFFRCNDRIIQIDADYFEQPKWFVDMQARINSKASD